MGPAQSRPFLVKVEEGYCGQMLYLISKHLFKSPNPSKGRRQCSLAMVCIKRHELCWLQFWGGIKEVGDRTSSKPSSPLEWLGGSISSYRGLTLGDLAPIGPEQSARNRFFKISLSDSDDSQTWAPRCKERSTGTRVLFQICLCIKRIIHHIPDVYEMYSG